MERRYAEAASPEGVDGNTAVTQDTQQGGRLADQARCVLTKSSPSDMTSLSSVGSQGSRMASRTSEPTAELECLRTLARPWTEKSFLTVGGKD